MNFYLTNEHRRYMGLKPIKENYELLILKNDCFQEFYLFFDGINLVKLIEYSINDEYISMYERDVFYQTNNEKTLILPKTNRGKVRKLTGSVVESLKGEDNYFTIQKRFSDKYGRAIIGNYTNQRTFYEDVYIENCNSLKDIEDWCNKFVSESSEQDLDEVLKFSSEKRKHCSFKEGDYFRVKLGRNQYTYGRILLDVYKGMKNKTLNYWNIVMGKPLIIEIFHILTTRKDVSINELMNLKTFPSQHIMDNCFYYGEYEIIGNGKLPNCISYPIMYGRGISSNDSNKIIFQCGKIHLEKEYNKNQYYGQYLNNGVGFNINLDEKLIERCIKEKSNKQYWKKYEYYNKIDLRSPLNHGILTKILNEYGLKELISIYEEIGK